jgi:cell division protein FtsW
VPEYRTDFIFALVGEELGLAGTGTVVLAYGLFALAGLGIAWRARDMFGLLLGSGLTFLVSLQALINMGVVTSLLPNKGLPLPLVSKGGSNLFIMLILVGLLFSVARTTARSRSREGATFEIEESAANQA